MENVQSRSWTNNWRWNTITLFLNKLGRLQFGIVTYNYELCWDVYTKALLPQKFVSQWQYHDVHLGTCGINQFVNCLVSVFGAPP